MPIKLKHHREEIFQLKMPYDEALQRFSNVNTKDIETELPEEDKATPFVKWVGGKRSIINEITAKLPASFENYYEPFVGGGALFYEIFDKPKKSFLSDTNFDLVITYNVIKKDLPKLLVALKIHEKKHNEDYFYKIRAMHTLQDPIEIASRFLYLNKTCYNGLYRVNRKGEFNTPVGRYTNPAIVSEKNLTACSKTLKNVTIQLKNFKDIAPEKNDFVYFDPPYHPTNETSFTAYSKLEFTEKDQTELKDFITELHKKGVKIMLSNSNTTFIKDLYKGSIFTKNIVHAPRLVNCKGNGRNVVEELLITNY